MNQYREPPLWITLLTIGLATIAAVAALAVAAWLLTA